MIKNRSNFNFAMKVIEKASMTKVNACMYIKACFIHHDRLAVTITKYFFDDEQSISTLSSREYASGEGAIVVLPSNSHLHLTNMIVPLNHQILLIQLQPLSTRLTPQRSPLGLLSLLLLLRLHGSLL